jgi:hypothetical protein
MRADDRCASAGACTRSDIIGRKFSARTRTRVTGNFVGAVASRTCRCVSCDYGYCYFYSDYGYCYDYDYYHYSCYKYHYHYDYYHYYCYYYHCPYDYDYYRYCYQYYLAGAAASHTCLCIH